MPVEGEDLPKIIFFHEHKRNAIREAYLLVRKFLKQQ